MSKDIGSEERKITVDSKAIGFFFGFILIEGYLIISRSLGSFPFSISLIPPYSIIIESSIWLYILYWIGILCLILGLLVGKYNKIYPPVVLIGSVILFIIFILPLTY
jgi:hypothetical protein